MLRNTSLFLKIMFLMNRKLYLLRKLENSSFPLLKKRLNLKINSNSNDQSWMIFIPLILFANYKSLLINVTLLQWIAQKFASYKTDIIYAYDAYWRAAKADIWRRNYLILYNIYLTSLENLIFLWAFVSLFDTFLFIVAQQFLV